MVQQDDYWSPIPLFILFRESIEAAIIVAVLLQFLNRTGPWLKKQVWWGVFMGATISIGVGIIFIVLYYKAQNDIFRGRNQLIFKGVCSWIAALLIGLLGFAMLRFMGWEEKWQRRLRVMAQKVQEEEAEAVSNLVEHGGVPPAALTWKDKALHYLSCGWVCRDANMQPRAGAVAVQETAHKAKAGCAAGINRMLRKPEAATTTEEEGQQAVVEKPRPTHTNPNWAQRVFLRQQPRELTEEELQAHDDAALQRVEDAKNKVLHDMLPASQRYQLFTLAFVTVLREGLETMIFLAGVGNSKPSAIPLAGVIGIICGVTVGVILYYTGKQIKDIYVLMIVMSTVIFFIGAGQAENGANSLMYAGAFGTYIPPSGLPHPTAEYKSMGLLPVNAAVVVAAGGAAATFNDGDEVDYTAVVQHDDQYTNPAVQEQPWYFGKLWDISGCCSDKDDENRFLALMNKIVGYNAKPTFVDVAAYCGYWVLILLVMMWKLHRGTLLDADYKHTKEVKKRAKQAARDAAIAKGIAVPPEPESFSSRIKGWGRHMALRIKGVVAPSPASELEAAQQQPVVDIQTAEEGKKEGEAARKVSSDESGASSGSLAAEAASREQVKVEMAQL